MKAIILARVSSKDQEEGQSIPAQVRRLTEYAERRKIEIEKIFQITESSSKETRKQFDEIIRLVRKHKDKVALITDTVDRLQRSFRETPLLDEMRRQGKLELHFLREGLVINQESNSAQLLQWDIGVLFASSYVRQLSDNVKRSKEQSVRNGEWICKAPIGYKNVTLPNGKKTIEVDPNTAFYVTKMFELYATGLYSLKKVEAKIAEMGLRNSLGNPIKANQVDFILNNPFYYGEMKVKGQLYAHNYPPLVTQALYDEVQAVKKGHDKAPVQYAGKPMLFRGLITCDECGCAVTGDIKKGKYVYYSCNNAKGLCKKSWIREEALLEPILAYFDCIQLPEATVNEILGHLRKAFEHEQEFFNQSQASLRKELDQIQQRLSRLIDEHLDGNIDAGIYQQKLQEYKKRQKEITREMEAHVDADETCLLTIKTVVDLARRAKEIYLSSNLDEKRELLNLVFSNLKLRDKRLLVTLREPFSLLMAASHQPMCLRM